MCIKYIVFKHGVYLVGNKKSLGLHVESCFA